MEKIFLSAIFACLLFCSCSDTHCPEITIPDGYISQTLDANTNNSLDAIFTLNNPKLQNLYGSFGDSIFIIQNVKELMDICPDNVEVPSVDFSKNCIIYAHVVTSSISDELLSSNLYYNKDNNSFLFEICILRAPAGWTAIGQFFPFGVYQASPNIKNIKLVKSYAN